ncbi:MAG: hypothetical protein F6K26_46825, partial [Moorea sp. SIO2I5]|nr:hypothetical protein [Moorena sp. SIO2I5]
EQPAEPEKYNEGKSYGDPHLITFDGYRYSFQAVGEFTLLKSNDGEFEVQVRQSPVNSSLSLNSAVSMKFGQNHVALYSKDFPDSDTNNPLRINGYSVTVNDVLPLPDDSVIYRRGNNYVVSWLTGEKLTARVYQRGQFNYIDISIFIPSSRSTKYSGLLGNNNGNPNDELRFRSGEALPTQSTYGNIQQLLNRTSPIPLPINTALNLYLKKLNKDFGNSWRITQDESLFDYRPNQGTNTFTNLGFPEQYLNLGRLSTSELQAAEATCRQQGVESELIEGCVFDVAFSGSNGFARTAAQVSQTLDLLEELGISNPLDDLVPNPVRDVIERLPRIPGLPF